MTTSRDSRYAAVRLPSPARQPTRWLGRRCVRRCDGGAVQLAGSPARRTACHRVRCRRRAGNRSAARHRRGARAHSCGLSRRVHGQRVSAAGLCLRNIARTSGIRRGSFHHRAPRRRRRCIHDHGVLPARDCCHSCRRADWPPGPAVHHFSVSRRIGRDSARRNSGQLAGSTITSSQPAGGLVVGSSSCVPPQSRPSGLSRTHQRSGPESAARAEAVRKQRCAPGVVRQRGHDR